MLFFSVALLARPVEGEVIGNVTGESNEGGVALGGGDGPLSVARSRLVQCLSLHLICCVRAALGWPLEPWLTSW